MKRPKKGPFRKDNSLNAAATGIFEPSENPNKQLPHSPEIDGAATLVNAVERDAALESNNAAVQGKVELNAKPGPRDKIVGPDLGKRPHRPVLQPKQAR
jgi:hypothetical protein